ncbi:TetR/AcrR family transcriptional regulator [Roseinatronobacter alkalisoli]|uniref:TetR/AcrR family transcriptional regulator n=1 Tax=Roseinatronobacter alkalisoli TaxID=3028235 RepID=A0ABT5TCH5_9RHOB|nr:TetR/AcrR family transcriptional regulator [Roseinatronobacter sp. HJB301]MDD7972824.1 TetR/AcrR family transcriptional regulator [Roseinatronobacter sp. HJB301]
MARKAGVSVGSLYQYFPNKQALLRILLGQRIASAQARRPPELDEGSTASLEEAVLASVRWHVDIHLENPTLERALNDLAADVLEESELEAFERRYEAAIIHFLRRHTDRLRVGEVTVAAFLIM